ncbi:MAG: hypothetical protein V1664_00530 [Candidatus Uhrbacteria bacterium]
MVLDEIIKGDAVSFSLWVNVLSEPKALLRIAERGFGKTNDVVRALSAAVASLVPADIRDAAQAVLDEMNTRNKTAKK